MLNKIKNYIIQKWKALLIILGLTVSIAYGAEIILQEKIPEHLILKAIPENILKSELIDNGYTISYDYISDKKIKGDFKFNGSRYSNAQIISKQGDAETTRFYIGDHFYQGDNGDILIIEHRATTTIGAYEEQTRVSVSDKIKRFFNKKALADDIYTGSGDGVALKQTAATWTAARDATDATTANSVNPDVHVTAQKVGSYYYVYRSFLPFDTSTIPSGSTIDTAILYFYFSYVDGGEALDVIQTSQPDETTITTADFNNIAFIAGSGAGTTPSVGQYSTWTLDAIGKGWVKTAGDVSNCGSTAGFTCLGVISEIDTNNTQPDHRQPDTNAYASERADITEDPYLDVTYTAPSVDSCTYSGSGDWYINYSDNCYITSDVYVNGGCYFVNDGAGSFGTTANISCLNIEEVGYGFNIVEKYGVEITIRY